MPDDRSFSVVELERRLTNLIRIGSVASVDTSAATATVTIGDLTTMALPWLTSRAGEDRTWWAPSAGEQVVVLSPAGDLAQGIILPALYSDDAAAPASSATVRTTTYVDGATISYDTASSTLTADLPGSASLTSKGDVTITTQGALTASASGAVAVISDSQATITAPTVTIVATQSGAGAAQMQGSFDLVGDFSLTGNISMTGNIEMTGDVTVTGNVDASGTVSGSNI